MNTNEGVLSALVPMRYLLGLEMVFVKGGTFWMGAQNTDANGRNYDSEADSIEAPVHQVTLSDYYIGKYEVTQGQWQEVMGYNPSLLPKGDNYPVNGIKYYEEVQEFIRRLNLPIKKNIFSRPKISLPTEAQWEYAARGGNKSKGYKYSGSNNIEKVAWYRENSLTDVEILGSTDKSPRHHPVGLLSPNELGLYDMSGNVAELCACNGPYSTSPKRNPTGPYIRDERFLSRGGGCHSDARDCQISARDWQVWVMFQTGGFGLRLVLLP